MFPFRHECRLKKAKIKLTKQQLLLYLLHARIERGDGARLVSCPRPYFSGVHLVPAEFNNCQRHYVKRH